MNKDGMLLVNELTRPSFEQFVGGGGGGGVYISSSLRASRAGNHSYTNESTFHMTNSSKQMTTNKRKPERQRIGMLMTTRAQHSRKVVRTSTKAIEVSHDFSS